MTHILCCPPSYLRYIVTQSQCAQDRDPIHALIDRQIAYVCETDQMAEFQCTHFNLTTI